ncbi:MAG TPA: biopolymer transporter ExbD [Kofleriaceae bacterium]|nr:biopolymer transporter ExbD [Kofleriaceae bacterium]
MGVELSVGKKKRVTPHMNVTPLVDVVLVLLIIFMVITPMMVKQFWLHVPTAEKKAAALPAEPDPEDVPIVVTVRQGGTIWINKDQVALAELPSRLERIFAARSEAIVFFDAEDGVPYGDAMRVLDTARGGGAANIAVLTEAVVR